MGDNIRRKEWVNAFYIWKENSIRQTMQFPEIGWYWAKEKYVKYKVRFRNWITRTLEDWKCSVRRKF